MNSQDHPRYLCKPLIQGYVGEDLGFRESEEIPTNDHHKSFPSAVDVGETGGTNWGEATANPKPFNSILNPKP